MPRNPKAQSPTSAIQSAANEATPETKARHGFAAISLERQREIASLGGKAAHAKGTAHKFTSEQARTAGRKGGQVAAAKRAAAAKMCVEPRAQANTKTQAEEAQTATV